LLDFEEATSWLQYCHCIIWWFNAVKVILKTILALFYGTDCDNIQQVLSWKLLSGWCVWWYS